MTASKSLPPRPSLASLRKQAKALARDRSVTLRDAQYTLAREYGYAAWTDLVAEVNRRLGQGLEWAALQARRVIHDNDVDGLKRLLGEYPALVSWPAADGAGLLGIATGAYGDSFDADRERVFTRAACAEVLIDSGAIVTPAVCEGILDARARGLLELFRQKGLLPPTLDYLAALGDLEAVRAALAEGAHDLPAVHQAFLRACSFEHEAVALLLLERAIALDPEFGRQVDGRGGRRAFIASLIENRSHHFAHAESPWRVVVVQQVKRAVHDGDLAAFGRWLRQEPWLLGQECVEFQAGLIGQATLQDRGEFITALLDLDPALLRRQPPPESQAIEFAFTYARTHLVPLLARIWPLPDDLPHAAGLGNLARVKQWFDDSGAPALGDLDNHYPYNDPRARGHLHWDPPTLQQVLDTALAWAVVNRHFEVADFLLARGADINTNWSSHEPASLLHELVGRAATGETPGGNYESMRFLIDRGIDMTIKDYRWNATARAWALYAAKDQKMADWLEEAERRRNLGK